MQLRREAEYGGCNRQSFLLVGIEQRRRCTLEYHGQLPAQVIGILDASIEPLGTSRGMHMRSVARQEHMPYTVLVHHAHVGPEQREPRWIMQANFLQAGGGQPTGLDDLLRKHGL